MNSQPPFPLCCTPLDDHWPLPRALPGVHLLSTRFDPELLDPLDFARWEIPPLTAVRKRQSEYLAGRLCAREALRRVCGVPAIPAIGADRAPCWPRGVVGSITHGAGWASAVAASAGQWRGLGLDVEQCLAPPRAARLLEQILTPAERQRCAGLDDTQRALRVTLTFSLKESLFKALYPLVGQRFYFQDAELLDCDPHGHARLRLLSDLSPDWPRGSELDGQFARFDDYLLSLVSIEA